MQAHTVGAMICELCGHRDPVCASPIGLKHFECSACHRMSSVREELVSPRDGVWRVTCCQCGDQHFAVIPDGLMCGSCGTVQEEDWTQAG